MFSFCLIVYFTKYLAFMNTSFPLDQKGFDPRPWILQDLYDSDIGDIILELVIHIIY